MNERDERLPRVSRTFVPINVHVRARTSTQSQKFEKRANLAVNGKKYEMIDLNRIT